MIDIKVSGKGQKNIANFQNIPVSSVNGIRQCLYIVGRFLSKRTSENILRTRKTGRYYKYKGRRYRASAPGEFPANRSGTNRRSIQFIVKGKREMIFGADAKYSKYLEKSRPFLIRTIKETEGNQNKILHNEIKRFIENAYR